MNKPGNKNPAVHQLNKTRNAPEIRDNLDSRKNEEQDYKGDDVTHNAKPHHNRNKKKDK